MKSKKSISVFLIFIDLFVIAVVFFIKSNVFYTEKQRDVVAAANVLSNGDSALNVYKDKEIEEYVDSRPVIVYDNMTMEQLSSKLDKILKEPMNGKGQLLASYSLEKKVDPYLATAIILLETGCSSRCSSMVYRCNNVGGQKGSGCGAYAAFSTLDEGIKAFIDNLSNNFISRGLTTPETIGPRYAESKTWTLKVNNYIERIKKM